MANWVYVDLGFNTGTQMWMLEFHDAKGAGAGYLQARSIELRGGTTFQYGWPDNGQLPNGELNARNFWHVRQRILAEHVRGISVGMDDALVLDFKPGKAPTSEPPETLPEEVAAVEMAYSLADGKGFIDLVNADRSVVRTLKGRWIATENLNQRTVGNYPHIRLHSDRDEVHGFITTGTVCVIVGKQL